MLARSGANIVIAVCNAEWLAAARSEVAAADTRVVSVAGDVATAVGCAALVAATAKEFGGADILVCMTGTGSNETIIDAPD